MNLFFDGGCIPNPGKMEVAVVSADGRIKEHQKIHNGTNNEAEWLAFLWAVEIAIEKGAEDVTISGDSMLVISQAKGVWKVKQPSLQVYRDEFLKLKPKIKNLKLVHVRRDVNPAGIYIEQLQKR